MNTLSAKSIALFIILGIFLASCGGSPTPTNPDVSEPSPTQPSSEWQEEFGLENCTMVSEGKNDYFVLEPGFQLVLEGGNEVLVITVLDETLEVDGTVTRVIEEREWRNDEIIEVSRNFFAICEETKDVFYFGEEVDMYSSGILASHTGAWRAGENGARAGIIMPGDPAIGMKYYQEIAPDVAMDRAEVIRVDDTISTPAGDFSNVLLTKEGTALNLLEREFKTYAPGIGLIQDQNLLLTRYGFDLGE
ncbi:MAG: hypothetical protein JSV42_13605 [Chloroflexota bacterium]|nr:MAG: hypothetical protein JSV42_13605 [Chloroflexota bacterium]